MSAKSAEKEKSEIDPRIAARRDAVQSDRRRLRGRRWIIGAAVVAVLGFGWYLTRTGLLDVDRIEVQGVSVLAVDDVISASLIFFGEPLLEVNTSSSAAHILELPWIDTVNVQRNWVGRIVITVTERTPVAVAVDEEGTLMLLDATGRVLDIDGPFDGIDTLLEGVVVGDHGTTIDGSAGALEVASLLTLGVRSRVTSIVVNPDGTIELRLKPQGIVVFGGPTDLAAKVASLQIILGQVDQRNLASINVVNPETPVVVRTPK